MDIRDLLGSVGRAIRAHLLRSFLTLLGVIIGVMTIVVVVGSISGLNAYVADEMAILAPDVYTVQRFGMITSRKEFLEALKRPRINWQDVQRVRNTSFRHTREIAAATGTSVDVRQGNRRIKGMNLVGVTGNFNRVFSFEADQGAWFGETEDRAGQAVAVIGHEIQQALFPAVDPLGKTILVQGMPFRVIGTMAKKGGMGMGLSHDDRLYVPMQAYRQGFSQGDDDFELQVRAHSVPDVAASQDEVRSLLRAMRHTRFLQEDPFGIVTQEQVMDFWKAITGAAFAVLVLISAISLGVGGVVIMNIMLVSVAERTQEIGVRRALGATQKDIRRQFLLEAALLSGVGGAVGLLIGGALILVIRLATPFPAHLTAGIVLTSLVVSTGVGLLAGYLPARRASNLPVIDALRAE